jgi:hypothetical protein
MTKRLRVGDRIAYSRYGLSREIDRRCFDKPGRRGRIVGEGSEGHSWIIVWDGTVTKQNYHKSFLTGAPQEDG